MRSINLKTDHEDSGTCSDCSPPRRQRCIRPATVNLTAGPATATLPDGSIVPMWGYSCGAAVTGSTATCAPLNPTAGTSWSPVVITVPTGATGGLTINLTNNLSFVPTGAATANTVPTSIMIVGQVGGGSGNYRSNLYGCRRHEARRNLHAESGA